MPGRPGDADLEPADEVLPEVEDQGSRRGGDHPGDGAFPIRRTGSAIRPSGVGASLADTAAGTQPVGSKAGSGPAVDGAGGGVGLTGVDAAGQDRAAVGDQPGLVGGDCFGAAVGVVDLDLRERGRLVAVDPFAVPRKPQASVYQAPAVDADEILTGREQGRDVGVSRVSRSWWLAHPGARTLSSIAVPLISTSRARTLSTRAAHARSPVGGGWCGAAGPAGPDRPGWGARSVCLPIRSPRTAP